MPRRTQPWARGASELCWLPYTLSRDTTRGPQVHNALHLTSATAGPVCLGRLEDARWLGVPWPTTTAMPLGVPVRPARREPHAAVAANRPADAAALELTTAGAGVPPYRLVGVAPPAGGPH